MNKNIVLCVDDESNILHALRRLLRRENYTLLTAESGSAGLEQMAQEPAQVVISDQRMPGMTGVEFLQKIKELYPDTVRVILSGYADVGTIVEAINKGEVFRFFAKPWNDDDLRLAVRQCLEHYELVWQNHRLLQQVQEQNTELNRMNQVLDEMVENRTHTLRMAQEILATLPIPVMGVDEEGVIVLLNNALLGHFPNRGNIGMGNDIGEALTDDENAAVRECLETGQPVSCRLDGETPATIVATPLRDSAVLTGCVAVWV